MARLTALGSSSASRRTWREAGHRKDCSILPTHGGPLPTSAQTRWQDAEIGVIYHFDMPIAAGARAPNNQVRETFDPRLYDPQLLDTDQWLEAAVAAGAGYAVFTATHFNGFMQWQSDLYPYGMKQAGWRNGQGDVVALFVESCRRARIEPGIYFSTHNNVHRGVWGHRVDGEGATEKQRAFNRTAEAMTDELTSRYGPLGQIWYDAGVLTPAEGGPDVLPIFARNQPDAVFYHSRQRADHRWIGNESGHAGDPCWATMPRAAGELSHNSDAWKQCLYHGDPQGQAWAPAMVDVPLRNTHGVHNWFWQAGEDHTCYEAEEMTEMYYRSVGRNCNLVLGEVITDSGLVPESDIQRLRSFGQQIRRRFATPLAVTQGRGQRLELRLPAPQRIDHVEIMEELSSGERIRAYALDGHTGGQQWTTLCRGTSVGHKRIQRFAATEVDRVMLRVVAASAEPRISRLAVFSGA
jgi:alpha-L-fucosidase